MTQAELYTALKSLGMPVAYGEFVAPGVPPPFITYQFYNNDDIMADDKNAIAVDTYRVELYTKVKDPATEKLIQDKFKELNLPYSKTEDYIETEKMRQIVYEIELLGG